MRILMVSDVYFPRVNGVSTSIATFRHELVARGHRVTLVAPDYGTGQAQDDDVLRVPARTVLLDPEDRLVRRGAFHRLTGDIARDNYDLVHIQTPFLAHYLGLRLARRLGVPTVETYHTFFEEYLYHYVPFLPKGFLRGLARRFSRTQCNAVDALVVPSRAMLEALRRYGVEAPARVLPTGIEAKEFDAGDGGRFRTRHGIAPERPVLVYVGRVAHEKNIGFLLEVLPRVRERHPEVLLLIAGEGPAVGSLRRRAGELGLADNVRFVGYLARDGELQDCYCAGNAFVFASATETQGLVLLEAMALGVPVVSTAVMGTRDVVEGAPGALVAREEVPDFADKVCRLLDDPALARRMGREAREYALTWSAGALAESLLGYYGEVIGRFGGGDRREAAHATR